jgi:hypothetical protein
MSEAKARRGRAQFLLIALVFFGPLLFAAWLYYQGGALQPAEKANHGALLEPIVNLGDAVPGSDILGRRSWLLVYANDAACDEACERALYTLRQSRLMLGKEMDRLERVFLHGEQGPDNLRAAGEHTGLITLRDAPLQLVLENKKPGALAGGGYYLVDPHGNLVMYFDPDIDPREMVDDIKRLLKLSRIG